MKILVLNAGSSSQKSCLYEFKAGVVPSPSQPLWEAEIEWSHRQVPVNLRVATARASLEEMIKSESRADATSHLLRSLWSGPTKVIAEPAAIDVVGHRVVHGGLGVRAKHNGNA
jgi:acetate kinase